MMGIETLIERLRTESLYADKASLEIMDLCMEAATALSTLQDENEKLRAELEQVKRERDAIEQDFRAFAKQWWEEDSDFPCRWCKFENSGGCEWKNKKSGRICAGRAFEWRGPQKED